jgi:hypothetical protein
VYVSYQGEPDPRELAAATGEAYTLLRTRHWARIVMDLTRLRSVLTGVQVFDFATASVARLPSGARVALAVRLDQIEHASLVEKIARADGVLCASFPNREQAAVWVKETNPPCPPKARHHLRLPTEASLGETTGSSVRCRSQSAAS